MRKTLRLQRLKGIIVSRAKFEMSPVLPYMDSKKIRILNFEGQEEFAHV